MFGVERQRGSERSDHAWSPSLLGRRAGGRLEDREPPREELRGHDRAAGATGAVERSDRDARARRHTPSSTRHTAAPRSPARCQSQVQVARLGLWRSHRRQVGPASSSGPWRNWAVCSDSIGIPTASFNVSAPISAAARAPTSREDHRRRAAAVPRHEGRRGARLRARGQGSVDRRGGHLGLEGQARRRPRRSAGPRERTGTSAPRTTRAAWRTSSCSVPVSSPAPVPSVTSASAASELARCCACIIDALSQFDTQLA